MTKVDRQVLKALVADAVAIAKRKQQWWPRPASVAVDSFYRYDITVGRHDHELFLVEQVSMVSNRAIDWQTFFDTDELAEWVADRALG